MESCCQPTETLTTVNVAIMFATGAAISLGHCVGMCGPIQTAFALEQQRSGRTGRRFLPSLLRYHLGRVSSYVLIGAAFGLAGSAGGYSGEFQAWLSLAAGALVILGGAALAGLPGSIRLPRLWGRPVAAWTGRLLRAPGSGTQFLLGVANGFLPCGPVLAAAVASAAAAHPALGMAAMAAFGLGTIPALAVLGGVSHRLGFLTRQRFFRAGVALIAVMGVQLVLRGLAVLGVVSHLRFGEVVVW